MNTKALKTAIDWKVTGMVKGVKVHRIPIEGNGCDYGVGSDTYGYQIGKVADDGTWFEVLDKFGNLHGHAVLVTRKNSKLRGCYCWSGYHGEGGPKGKPYFYYSCGRVHGALGISDKPGCCETYLDPSF